MYCTVALPVLTLSSHHMLFLAEATPNISPNNCSTISSERRSWSASRSLIYHILKISKHRDTAQKTLDLDK